MVNQNPKLFLKNFHHRDAEFTEKNSKFEFYQKLFLCVLGASAVNHSPVEFLAPQRFCYSFDHAAPVTRPCLAKQPHRRISRSGLNITPVDLLSNRNASAEHPAK